ncbi:MAG: hypothetical protein LH606_20775 [Cytophagaceae bacterium]|nr:hypothetical protein [Cytophagaceae bacterium]
MALRPGFFHFPPFTQPNPHFTRGPASGKKPSHTFGSVKHLHPMKTPPTLSPLTRLLLWLLAAAMGAVLVFT